jgi:diaminohydroxyphosphoribosylaminopyrimidine deaminase/5-amino-6-(5-phosphoribosylamino)uracil reductase
MVESGPILVGALLQAGLLDELHMFVAPTLLGCDARPLAQLPLVHMGEQLRLHIEDVRSVGDDLWIRARPHKKRGQ